MLFSIWFAEACRPGNADVAPLLEHFDSAYDIFAAGEEEIAPLVRSYRLRKALADKSLARAHEIYDYCRLHDITVLTYWDERYPSCLRVLRDPPVILYCKGKLPDFHTRLCLSVVGTRRMSEYGKRMAYRIGYEMAAAGTVVVSGLALGNDGMAAAGALLAGGTTLAVLGCGLDRIYPAEHTTLASAILRRGAIVTEFAPGTPPSRENFPMRNRLISGLSQGTIVVEGDKRSGALITARHAVLQGRDIYAVPGNVGEPSSEGTNHLIQEGAIPVFCARDVMDHYFFLYDDVLDKERFRRAEKSPDPSDEALGELGVYVQIRSTRFPRKPSDGSEKGAEADAARAPRSTRRRGAKSPKTSDIPTPPPSPRKPSPQKVQESGASQSAGSASPVGDDSQRVLATLTDTQRRIFAALPLDRAVTVDYLVRENFSMSDIMASLTMLEISGLVVTLPGGFYTRR